MLFRGIAFLAFIIAVDLAPWPALAACIDLRTSPTLAFEETLSHRIFPGPPNFSDVRRGDTPQPGYYLQRDRPICVVGDAFSDPQGSVDLVQLSVDDAQPNASRIYERLPGLVGRRVLVVGKETVGAHTAHHHAPLLTFVVRVEEATDPTRAYGTAMTTVQAFYLALAAGDGRAAAALVVPEERQSGPFSARQIARFYGNLYESLSLAAVEAIAPDEFQVRYTFMSSPRRRCDGVSIVRTTERHGLNLIESIKALNGC